ncbi:lipopolysaccharide core heptose(II) kinase RfaY [uncultured Fusobacterium sp.]|uniref:lipopolysaccharide core heptose(II) kinase RfaY n=1 Tax=uncultured Fusobacterium sp. TaxID=159267 RepID=UPI00260D2DD4|nr:lipopolysaccharide core heptose(II) kinase RfaY [uncultured Fusobacterium sp.]
MKKERYGKDILYYNDEKYLKLYDKIKNTCYNIERVFKNDQRSYVALIEIDGEKYVLKRPIEKNRRKWQRFLSIFRGSESRREFENIQRINELGFNGATPYLAMEKKCGPCVVDSYLIYSYIKGEEGTTKDIDLISKELRKIHSRGYLHGDSQVMNFLIDGESVYLIDTKLMRNRYGKFGEVFEFIYLEESCDRDIEYDRESIYYKGAITLKRYLIWFAKFKKRLRGKK